MRVHTFSTLLLGFFALAFSGCQSAKLAPQASVATSETEWLKTELYFAIGRIPREAESPNEKLLEGEAMWSSFLDETVTPLFPDGLTVFDATGQWMSSRFEQPPRLATRVLVILHPNTDEANQKIEQIRAAFLEATGQQSVLRVTTSSEVSF